MNDEPHIPSDLSPEGDSQVDQTLAALTHFGPRAGFADRILHRVWVPLPLWARAMRRWLLAPVTGARGWLLLGTLSTATAAFWGFVTWVTISQWGVVAEGAQIAARELGLASWRDGMAVAAASASTAWAEMLGEIAAFGIPLRILAAAYAGVTLVSAVALWRLTVVPAHLRVGTYASR